MKSLHVCLNGNDWPKIGELYDYKEDGWLCEVKVLREANVMDGQEGLGWELEILNYPRGSAFGDIGPKFTVWANKDFDGAYSGMWRIFPRGTYMWEGRSIR